MARKPRKRTWGTGQVFERGGRWTIRWRQHGRRCSASYPTKELAEQVLAKVVQDIAAGGAGLARPTRDQATLEALAEEWLERRRKNGKHRSVGDDASRWRTHLLKPWGKLRPDQVTPRMIRDIVEAKLSEGLNSATCQRIVALVSTLWTDLVEQGVAKTNPAKMLPKATRALLKPTTDPRTTVFVEKLADVVRIYRALPEPVNVAYALGSLGGMRTGEILALQWSSVDLDHRRIIVSEQVQDGRIVPPKSKKARVVPIVDSLLPILQAARLRSGGQGLVVPPKRGSRNHLDPHTLGKCLREALDAINAKGEGPALPSMTWHQACRHTYASQTVLAGGSIERLKETLGHSSVLVTARYAHLKGDAFTAADLGRIAMDFSAPAGKVLPMVRPEPEQDGHALTTDQV